MTGISVRLHISIITEAIKVLLIQTKGEQTNFSKTWLYVIPHRSSCRI